MNKVNRHKIKQCPLCTRKMRSDNLKRHLKWCQGPKKNLVMCEYCSKLFSAHYIEKHIKKEH